MIGSTIPIKRKAAKLNWFQNVNKKNRPRKTTERIFIRFGPTKEKRIAMKKQLLPVRQKKKKRLRLLGKRKKRRP